MLYSDLQFTGEQIYKERARAHKEGLKAAAFCAWQQLAAQSKGFPPWGEYLEKLGLTDKPKLTREDLKREADDAIQRAQAILRRGANGGR